MSTLFSKPKIKTPKVTPTPREVSPEEVERKRTELRRRLASMMGRQQTVLTGPLGETNRRTFLGF